MAGYSEQESLKCGSGSLDASNPDGTASQDGLHGQERDVTGLSDEQGDGWWRNTPIMNVDALSSGPIRSSNLIGSQGNDMDVVETSDNQPVVPNEEEHFSSSTEDDPLVQGLVQGLENDPSTIAFLEKRRVKLVTEGLKPSRGRTPIENDHQTKHMSNLPIRSGREHQVDSGQSADQLARGSRQQNSQLSAEKHETHSNMQGHDESQYTTQEHLLPQQQLDTRTSDPPRKSVAAAVLSSTEGLQSLNSNYSTRYLAQTSEQARSRVSTIDWSTVPRHWRVAFNQTLDDAEEERYATSLQMANPAYPRRVLPRRTRSGNLIMPNMEAIQEWSEDVTAAQDGYSKDGQASNAVGDDKDIGANEVTIHTATGDKATEEHNADKAKILAEENESSGEDDESGGVPL